VVLRASFGCAQDGLESLALRAETNFVLSFEVQYRNKQ